MEHELFGCYAVEVKTVWILLTPSLKFNVSIRISLIVEFDDHLFNLI